MKNSKVAIISIGAIIVVIGIALMVTKSQKPINKPQTIAQTTQTPVASPTLVPSASPITTATPTIYTAAFRAKVRGDFVHNCNINRHYTLAACNCAADYLSKNYSDTELAKMYVQFYTTSQVPSAIKTAVSTCAK